MKEALKNDRAKQIFDEIIAMRKTGEMLDESRHWKEIEDILLKREAEDNDFVGLSSAINKYLNVQVDIKSLGVLDQVTHVKQNKSVSDAQYLHKDRCLAESRLIKTKIMYKLYEGLPLT